MSAQYTDLPEKTPRKTIAGDATQQQQRVAPGMHLFVPVPPSRSTKTVAFVSTSPWNNTRNICLGTANLVFIQFIVVIWSRELLLFTRRAEHCIFFLIKNLERSDKHILDDRGMKRLLSLHVPDVLLHVLQLFETLLDLLLLVAELRQEHLGLL